MIEDETQQSVEQGEINLLVYLRGNSLHQDIAFTLAGLPDVGQVVDYLAPLVDQQRWRLGILREGQVTNT